MTFLISEFLVKKIPIKLAIDKKLWHILLNNFELYKNISKSLRIDWKNRMILRLENKRWR